MIFMDSDTWARQANRKKIISRHISGFEYCMWIFYDYNCCFSLLLMTVYAHKQNLIFFKMKMKDH